MRVANKEFSKNAFCAGPPRINPAGMARGSALILTVVLTSLLAIVGVLFLMVARVDRMATSAVSQSLELDLAVDTVVAKISGQLIWDVPGTKIPGRMPPAPQYAEYHDYPGPEDEWLAVIEPYEAAPGNYFWRRISDIYGRFGVAASDLPVAVVPDYQDPGIMAEGLLADADGDGIADSLWVIVPGITSSKGQPVFVAVRIIDNGGMINVNAAFKFDPADPNGPGIDGASLLQINLMGLTDRGVWTRADEEALLLARGIGIYPYNLSQYESAVTWSYGQLPMPYTPFDISDELELRNRFLLNQRETDTRIERFGWARSFLDDGFGGTTLEVPIGSGSSGTNLDGWFLHAKLSDDPTLWKYYDYRHIATAYSMDRIITPDGNKMVAVTDFPLRIFGALMRGIDPNLLPGRDANDLGAQLAVNIKDFSDPDLWVTSFRDPRGKMYYGVEPQPFISEIAFKISGDTGVDAPTDSGNNSFAVELYNPFDVDIPLAGFKLELRNGAVVVYSVSLAGTIAADSRYIIINGTEASTDFGITGLLDPNLVLAKYTQKTFLPESPDYEPEEYDIYLIRTAGGSQIYLDRQDTEDAWFNWLAVKDTAKFYSRADNDWNIVYQVFDPNINTLDRENRPPGPGPRKNYNIPSFAIGLRTVGDIARVLTVGPSSDPNDMIGVRLATEPNEWSIRIDLQNPAFANIFQYLTVIDPTAHGRPAGEARIKGRININTAPPFVIAQLPWVGREVAQAIVAYRDKLQLLPGIVDYSGGRARGMWDLRVPPPPGMLVREEHGFANIWELLNVTHALNVPLSAPLPAYAGPFDIRKYGHGRDKDPGGVEIDQAGFPDLTPSDGVANDFEERDLIFSRLSDLATVRSDVFTAYILVRIGANGPQKRVIAILDRSGVSPLSASPYTTGKVKVRALHPVPDPW